MTNGLRVLSDLQIEQFREATEDLLENVGFEVQHEEILKKAKAAGAVVDEASGNLKLPGSLFRELVAQIPSSYTIRGVGGQEWEIGAGTQYFGSLVNDPFIIDYETGRPRRPRLEDVRTHTIIGQKLDSVAMIYCMDFPMSDVPGPQANLRAFEMCMTNHDKHIPLYPTSMDSYRDFLEIGRILNRGNNLQGSRLFSVSCAVVSPLVLAGENAEQLLSVCENDFIMIGTTCPMAGSTSPYTLASTLLIDNTETIFIAALAQILKPGQPCSYCVGPSLTDMRSGHDLYYTLDKVLWKTAGLQLGRSYNIPLNTETGGTMNERYDVQAGAEGMLFMLAAHGAGASVLGGLGSFFNANGMSAEMMIIQTGWLEAAKHLTRGINTDDLHMGLENIKSAGPGGNFLMDDLTMQFLRGGEFFSCDLFDYSGGYEDGPSMLERAHEKVEELTADYISPVPEDIQEGIRRYFHDKIGRSEN